MKRKTIRLFILRKRALCQWIRSEIIRKETVGAGTMLLIDLEEGRIVTDAELKEELTTEKPYRAWLEAEMTEIADLAAADLHYEAMDKSERFKNNEHLVTHKTN